MEKGQEMLPGRSNKSESNQELSSSSRNNNNFLLPENKKWEITDHTISLKTKKRSSFPEQMNRWNRRGEKEEKEP